MKSQQLDSEKIRKLLNSATNSRQRKMYQSLLDKAIAQEKISTPSAPATKSKNTETSAKTSDKTQKKKNKKKDTVSASNKKVESEKPKETKPVAVTPEKPIKEEEILDQAVGTLVTTPYIKDDELKVKIDELEYDLLYVPGMMKKVYKALKKELSENRSNEMLFKVYPKSGLSLSSIEPNLFLSLARFKLNNFDENVATSN